jgi:hypothetical protein
MSVPNTDVLYWALEHIRISICEYEVTLVPHLLQRTPGAYIDDSNDHHIGPARLGIDVHGLHAFRHWQEGFAETASALLKGTQGAWGAQVTRVLQTSENGSGKFARWGRQGSSSPTYHLRPYHVPT